MQRDNHRRGFSISHQKVVLEIDFAGALWGYTEITVIPTSKDLKTIHLNSRQCTIHSATVASYPADFVQYDPFTNITLSNAQDLHNHPELKRRVYSAYAEGEEGELSISLPKEVHLRQHVGSRAGSVVSESTPEPGATHSQSSPYEFAPITLHIEYSLRNPVDGIQFILPSDTYPYRVPHAFTTPSAPDAARCWVPCIDSMWEKCTWEFEFVVPRYLEERDAEDGEEFDDHQGEYSSVVICSGELVEQVAHPYNSSKTIFLFSQPIATSVQQVAWAAGPFHVYPIPAEHLDDTSGSQPLMHAFCLPGHESQLASSVAFIRSAMNFFLTDLGSYPYGSHKLVFVDELPVQRLDSATLSLCTVDLLHGEDAIDQVYETRLSLSHALACQWVGINIHPKTNSDLWLTNGLGLYVTGMFLRKILGQNEYRYRMKKDMERVYESDNGQMPPICQPQVLDPPDSVVMAFINVKAPLVLHILDRRLCKSGTSLGLSRVLPKIFLSAISGELVNNALSTHAFLRMCRKVSGMDPRSFAEQWIYGSGCPSFNFTASFNRKKMAVEILMRQESPAYKANENSEMAKALLKPVPFFEGQMTIRIHEADGTPYEHVLDIRTPFKRFEVPFNTKYKRVRRNTKRYMARQAAAQAAAEGGMEGVPEAGAAPGPGELVDVGFGVDIWDNDQERDNWKIAEWTEEDEAQMSGATYEWIRLDADFEWITSISFEQPIFMWVSQLQRDRDVVAQIEAVRALGRQPTAIVSSILTKTVLTTKYFYRIRCDAAVTLAKCAIPRLDYLGLFHLFKLFLRYCYDPEDPHQDLFTHTYVPRSNDFSDLAEYFVRKALLNGLSRVRFDTGKTPAIIRQFLIDQLRFNDNTSNPYSDAYYICTVISALGAATVPAKPPERNELVSTEIKLDHSPEDARLLQNAMAEVDRYRSMDRLIPSYHNVVTIAAIDFYLLLSLADLIPSDPRMYFPLTREGNYTQVRMAAFDALFLTKWYTPKIMRYFLAVMSNDPSRVIRRHVARNACQSLALLFTMGELKASSKDNEALLIEEDGSVPPEKVKEQKKSELDLMIKALRKDREVGKNEAIREFLMPVALAPDVDYEVRWYLLKLADMLVRGAEEQPPKVTIHLPPTPVTEAPPPLPVVKLKGQSRPSIKIDSAVPARSPATPFAATPKLKLLPGGSLASGPSSATPTPKRSGSIMLPKAPKPVPASVKTQKPTSKHVPRARMGGMELNDLHACRNMLKKLQMNKHATLFLQPVDPIRDKAPNYFDVIKNPMDLTTLGAKLEAGKYTNKAGFENDFRLMINNCKQYNMDGTYAFNEALALEAFFDKQWERIKKTLENVAQRQAVTKPAPKIEMPPPAPPAVVARPSVKIKLGSVHAGPSERGDSSASATNKSIKIKRPKSAVDLPPPPYVDDGSHDLLQEVIAIEKEQNNKRPINPSVKLNVGKRKRQSNVKDADDLDDILDLATPSKRDKAATPPSQAPASQAPRPKAAADTRDSTSQPKPRPKLVLAPKGDVKSREGSAHSAGLPAVPTPVTSTSSAPRITIKGKEKEKEVTPRPAAPAAAESSGPVPVPASTSKPKKVLATTAETPTPISDKKCKAVLNALYKMPEAAIFAVPVDPIRDGCPTYYDEIKTPMDFGTMHTKLSNGQYTTMEEFAKDARLVFRNCRQFNPPGTYPVTCADKVEQVFDKEWAKAMEKKLTWQEKRSLIAVVNKLVADPISWVFREPVDPIALGIPTYFEIIPKKDARDLRTIKRKLDEDKYESVDAFRADFELMIRNAITFNGAESEVGQMAHTLLARFKDSLASSSALAASLNASSAGIVQKKRKDGDRGTPQPMPKKLKLV